MKKIIILSITLLFIITCFAQQVSLERAQVGPHYRFGFNRLPVLGPPEIAPDPSKRLIEPAQQPSLISFVEYGDGYFDYNVRNLSVTRPFYSGNGSNYDPLAVMYALYTPKPPTIASKISAIASPDFTDPIDTTQKILELLKSRSVALVPSISNLIPSDLVTIAVPYKLSDANNAQLILLYNNNGEENAFEPVAANHLLSFSSQPPYPDVSTSPVGINAIRPDRKGVRVMDAIPTEIMGNAEFARIIGGFSNHVTLDFTEGYAGDELEHNFFLSLKTTGSVSRFWNLDDGPKITNIHVLLIANNELIGQYDIPLSVSKELTSHDPNSVSCFPNCLVPDKNRGSRNFHFDIQFENDGEGDASKILIQPRLDANRTLRLRNVSQLLLTLGQNQYLLQQDPVPRKTIIPTDPPGTFIINFGDTLSYSAIGTPSVLLKGTRFPGIIERNGSISFICSGNLPDIAATVDCVAGIYFDKNLVYLTPHPEKISISGDCANCPKTGSPNYWWIILIILLALIVALLLWRRRRH